MRFCDAATQPTWMALRHNKPALGPPLPGKTPDYIVGGAEQARTKAKRRGLLTAVTTTRRDMVKMRAARKKIGGGLCKEVRAKAKAQAKRHSIHM